VGQVSLPRLERINSSMTWESSYWNHTEHWVAPKLFIFYRPFLNLAFSFKTNQFFRLWYKKKTSSAFWASKHTNIKIRYSLYKTKRKLHWKVNNRYIYLFNNVATTLVVYSPCNERVITTARFHQFLKVIAEFDILFFL
jgi:hypothetical protein